MVASERGNGALHQCRRRGRQPQAAGEDLRPAVNKVPTALYTCAPNEVLSITFASAELRDQFALDPLHVLGGSGTWVGRAHPEDVERIANPLPVLLKTGSFSSEFRLLSGWSDYRWVQNELRLVRYADGRPREVIGYLFDITQCREARASLERSRQSLRDLASHLQSVREAERAAIAREIHDEMGQGLAALKIDLVRLRSRLDRKGNGDDLLTSIIGGIDGSIAAVQRIMAELRPSVLDDLGLIPALEWYLERFQVRTAIPCTLEVRPAVLSVDKDVATALFRILQEAVQNVARHAEATQVQVSLAQDPQGRLHLCVSDNGKGISRRELEDRRSFGLLEIRERAEVFGGTVEIKGEPGRGTDVNVTIRSRTVSEAWRDAQAAHGG
jgi:two-component system sensor histidine kinase UhpB